MIFNDIYLRLKIKSTPQNQTHKKIFLKTPQISNKKGTRSKLKNKQVLSIAGSDSGAGAGIQADLKTFSAIGVYGTTVITSITSQNTKSVNKIFNLPKEHIQSQITSVLDDFNIKVIKIGMLNSKQIINSVSKLLSDRNYNIISDPVMVAESGDLLLEPKALETYKNKILPIADLITPNKSEAEKLSGKKIDSHKDLVEASREIIDIGPDYVVVTGGDLGGNDYFIDKNKITEIEGENFDIKSHGSGCSFSSAIASYITKSYNALESVKKAHKFTKHAIKESHEVGHGNRPVNQFYTIQKGKNRYEVFENFTKALNKLPNSFEKLIPEVGSNLAMATKYAENTEDVIAIPGRIVSTKNDYEIVGCPTFGASSHMARLILETKNFNRKIRSAINIKYSKTTIEKLKEKNYSLQSFNRKNVSKKNTMASGAKKAIEKFGGVPDIIYDKGEVGKEPMIRILGTTALDVVKKIYSIKQNHSSPK